MTRQRECSIEDLKPRFKAEIKNYLSKDEPVLLCLEYTESPIDAVITRLQLGSIWFLVCVVTPKRIIVVHNAGYHIKLTTMFLTDVFSIQEGKEDDSYQVTVHGTGDPIPNWFKHPDEAARFASLLRHAVDTANGRPGKSMPSSQSAEQRLRALVQLRKDGLITDAEFCRLREEILSRL